MRRKKVNAAKRTCVRSQREVLRDVMLSAGECGTWLTLSEISALTRYGEASISAQLRHLRKPQYGAYAIDKHVRKGGAVYRNPEQGAVWEYRLRRVSRAETRKDWLGEPVLLGMAHAAGTSPSQ